MIQLRSMINPADNSGAKKFAVIGVSTKIGKKATVGDVANCVVRGATPAGAVENKEKVKVLIVRTRNEIRRKDGSYVRFDDNACVIIWDDDFNPKWTRIFWPVARELKSKGFQKIVSLAPEVL